MALVVIRIEPPQIKMNIKKNLKSEYLYLTVERKQSISCSPGLHENKVQISSPKQVQMLTQS